MAITLRQAWLDAITAEDYEAHMAAAGQAQANAALVGELLHAAPPPAGAALLVAGAGTGQMFDYLDGAALRPFRVTFTDIHAGFLGRLAGRLREEPNLVFETIVDDIEDSRLDGPFALAIVVLVLEHVDWRRAVASLCRVAARVFVVIQETPPGGPLVQPPAGTLRTLLEAPPHAVPQGDLEAGFAALGRVRVRAASRDVAGGKRMVALEFAEPRRTEIP